MPLTNPNKVVTEERLSEFYGQILPYMGGMPDVLANKFSKGDLYSTDEKMIGVWTDGKPLYQKTMFFTAQSGEITLSHGIANVDKVVNVTGGIHTKGDYAGYMWPLMFLHHTAKYQGMYSFSCHWVNSTQFSYFCGTDPNFAGSPAFITFQYTKTTDSPISIGVDTDYSTNEKIVGTWIDGKPLYQKTIQINNPTSATSYIVENNIEIKSGFSLLAFIYSGSVLERSPYYMSASDYFQCLLEGDHAFLRTSLTNLVRLTVTAQYTKTS